MPRNPSHESNNVKTKAASWTVLADDDVYIVNTTSTATFPVIAGVAGSLPAIPAGKTFTFIATGAVTMTFTAGGSDTFPVGKAVVNADGEVACFMSDGVSKWYTVFGLIS